MPDGSGTHEVTRDGMGKIVIALPHGGSITVQFNPCLVVEHPIIRYVLCVNTLQVGFSKYTHPLTLTVTVTVTVTLILILSLTLIIP